MRKALLRFLLLLFLLSLTACNEEAKPYGVYVIPERNDVCSLTWACGNHGGGVSNADSTPFKAEQRIWLDLDLPAAEDIYLSLKALAGAGNSLGESVFIVKAGTTELCLRIKEDGLIRKEE